MKGKWDGCSMLAVSKALRDMYIHNTCTLGRPYPLRVSRSITSYRLCLVCVPWSAWSLLERDEDGGVGTLKKKIIRATIRVASQSEEEGAEIKEIEASEWRQGLQAHTMPQTNGTSRAPEEKRDLANRAIIEPRCSRALLL